MRNFVSYFIVYLITYEFKMSTKLYYKQTKTKRIKAEYILPDI